MYCFYLAKRYIYKLSNVNILKDVDPVIMLDADQRKVILTDEDYCLVIAGAGAGKTTTVAAKVNAWFPVQDNISIVI